MDAGIADTLNRQLASRIFQNLDNIDYGLGFYGDAAWHNSSLADTILGTNNATNADRAWLVGALLANPQTATGASHRDYPADEDWDNLFTHFRAEILARRDTQTPPARAAETQPCGAVV